MEQKIYILAPANTVTGGPELLHQLCYKLKIFGYNAGIYYYQTNDGDEPVVPAPYLKYNVTVFKKIEDIDTNYIIFPEAAIPLLPLTKNAKRILWWLSVDNAVDYVSKEDMEYVFKTDNLIHFSQSEYANIFLNNNGIDKDNIYWLCDYINSEFLHLNQVSDSEKEDVVVFNPSKGMDKTIELIKNSYGLIKWLPLAGFTAEGVRDILQKSKVYIDFGNHPGRDRIPREATYCGCCLITNRNGSAENNIDIPIDDKYKIDNNTNPKEIISFIHKFFNEYSIEKMQFDEYRQRTSEEFRLFEEDILSIFEKLVEIKVEDTTETLLKKKIIDFITENNYEEAFTCTVKYRLLNYSEDLEYLILESTVRAEVGELNEAEFIANKALELDNENYEILLILAKIHLLMGKWIDIQNCLQECSKAISLSVGTEDEEVVSGIATEYISRIKDIVSNK